MTLRRYSNCSAVAKISRCCRPGDGGPEFFVDGRQGFAGESLPRQEGLGEGETAAGLGGR
jgi:hypothetical protein